MRSDLLQFVFYAVAIVLGGAFEEILPKCQGVGFPVLLALSVFVAVRRPAVTMVIVALVAGSFEDALSSLPRMTSSCLFLAAAVLARKTRLAKVSAIVAYPLYQVWLNFLVPGLAGTFGMRFLMAVPISALTVSAVGFLLAWAEGKAAIDEA